MTNYDKKRKHQTNTFSSTNSKKPQKKTTTELEQQTKQRAQNRKLATKLAEIGKKQLEQKYPLQQNVLTAPKFTGIHFPLKQETQRLTNRAKVNQLIQDIKKQYNKK